MNGLANAVTMLVNKAMRIEQSRYLNAKPLFLIHSKKNLYSKILIKLTS